MRLIHIIKKHDFDSKRKGSNILTSREIDEGYLFQNFGSFSVAPDVTMIVGSDGEGTQASVLLCRFHNLVPSLSNIEKNSLFKHVWDSLKSTKFESKRSGGSSGLTQGNNVFKRFVSNPGTSPRNGKGSVWIQGRHVWYLYYIGTFDGKSKNFAYTNPVPGGSFHFKVNALERFPFLLDFVSTKPFTALLIDWIQPRIKHKPGFRIQIAPQAVESELMKITDTECLLSCTRAGISHNLSDNKRTVPDAIMKMNRKAAFYSVYSQYHVKYTLICHPVGFHLDYFANNLPSIENKVCFEISKEFLPDDTIYNSNPNGRGGCSSDNLFVFAILDW